MSQNADSVHPDVGTSWKALRDHLVHSHHANDDVHDVDNLDQLKLGKRDNHLRRQLAEELHNRYHAQIDRSGADS